MNHTCQDQIRDESDDTKLVMLAQGNTAEIYQYGSNKILKLFREQLPFNAIKNEYCRARMIQQHLDNVPKACEMLRYRGRIGIVYEQIIGDDMISSFLKHPFQLKKNSQMLAQIHIQMHANDIDVAYSVQDKLKRDISNVKELTKEEKEKIYAYIDTLPQKGKLCHFDFHPGNIMLQGNQPMIIDWMTACTGDPNADVCRTMLLMQTGEMMHINPILRKLLHWIMKMIGREYSKEYKTLSGATDEEINVWRLPVAAARLSEWLTPHEREKLISLVKHVYGTTEIHPWMEENK